MGSYDIFNLIVAFDVLMNLFFHLIHLRRFCNQTDVLRRINHRFNHFESKLSRVDFWARSLYESSGSCSSGAVKGEAVESITL